MQSSPDFHYLNSQRTLRTLQAFHLREKQTNTLNINQIILIFSLDVLLMKCEKKNQFSSSLWILFEKEDNDKLKYCDAHGIFRYSEICSICFREGLGHSKPATIEEGRAASKSPH